MTSFVLKVLALKSYGQEKYREILTHVLIDDDSETLLLI